jgi:hypothetical protein
VLKYKFYSVYSCLINNVTSKFYRRIGLTVKAPILFPQYDKLQLVTEYQFIIFDRLGKMVFILQDINVGWDGLLTNDEKAKIDVYTWQITFKAYNPISKLARRLKLNSGRVSLLR